MESIEVLNERLINVYGRYLDERPLFRLIYSENVTEIRDITHTKEGLPYLHPEPGEVKKYSWLNNKYILEGLRETGVLRNGKVEGIIDYEPMWVFEDKDGNPLPPDWLVIQALMESARCAQEGRSPNFKNIEDENDPEVMAKRLEKIQEQLFPNETEIGDALAYKEAIVVPRNYTKEN